MLAKHIVTLAALAASVFRPGAAFADSITLGDITVTGPLLFTAVENSQTFSLEWDLTNTSNDPIFISFVQAPTGLPFKIVAGDPNDRFIFGGPSSKYQPSAVFPGGNYSISLALAAVDTSNITGSPDFSVTRFDWGYTTNFNQDQIFRFAAFGIINDPGAAPLPSSRILFLIGLAGLGFVFYRRRIKLGGGPLLGGAAG
jgi:hypothetical protein